ncbi:MAG: hypothetical protein WBA57_22170 [Elainellaceae cyanobacterium]
MKPVSHLFSGQSTPQSVQSAAEFPLTANGSYTCPVCRHGNITQLTLMDAFACDFCRHIFEANFEQQTVHVVDSYQPIVWRWNGDRWRSRRVLDESLTLFLWIISIALVILPVSMIGISLYIFPPMVGTRLDWFPLTWTACTFFLHLLLVSWLLAEHYQPALYVMVKLRLNRFMSRLIPQF